MGEEMIYMESESRLKAHPWKRYLAHLLDIGAYDTIVCAVVWLGIGLYPPQSRLSITVLQLAIFIALGMVMDTILLAIFGTTLGKWIFGIRVLHKSGRKLTLKEAFGRNFLRWIYGEGFGIIGVNLFCYFKSYKACKRGETMQWDEEVSYVFRDQKHYRGVVFAACAVAVFFCSSWIGVKALMPRIQGEWTKDVFWENYTSSMTNVFHFPIYHPDMEFVEDGDTLKEIRIEREQYEGGGFKSLTSEASAIYAAVGMEPGNSMIQYPKMMRLLLDYAANPEEDFYYEDSHVTIERTKNECVISIKNVG